MHRIMFHRVNSNVNIGHIYGFCVRICGGTTETWDAKKKFSIENAILFLCMLCLITI